MLPDNKLLEESSLQHLIDTVYPVIDFESIDCSAVFVNGTWLIKELCHNANSALLEVLDINSAACIIETPKSAGKTHKICLTMMALIVFLVIANPPYDRKFICASVLYQKPHIRHHSTRAKELGCIRMMPVPSDWTSSATSVYVRTESVRWQRARASETPGTAIFTSAVSVTLLSSE